jgi:SpoVK/Ycf46/Vps4 family AAA+-type ATPase
LAGAGARGDQALFRKALEALVAEERGKQHHILADRLARYLVQPEVRAPVSTPAYRNGQTTNLFVELNPMRRLDDLILSDVIRAACWELVEEQNRADLLRSYNLEPRHRVLLAGPPGNGKTSLAEALAGELAIPLMVVRYETVIASYLGETAVRLSRLFDQVRSIPCVLFFDEFDVVGKERGDIHETGEIKRVVSSLLLQVDALPSYVVVVTATNHPELLDRAVWRRFQVRLELPPPTAEQTEEWFRRFEERAGVRLGVQVGPVCKNLEGASFSDLEQFSQDILRRYVLSGPDADMGQIVRDRMTQWRHRCSAVPAKEGKRNG